MPHTAEKSGQFAQIIGPLAHLLLGEPNRAYSSEFELRYGSRGSFSVDLRKGTWYDHEAEQGGGVLDLVAREKGLIGPERLEWLKSQGFDIGKTNGGIKPRSSSIIATYDYQDEDGTLLFQVVRYEPKNFKQRRKPRPDDPPEDIKGGWVWNVQNVKRVPYRLPDVLDNDDKVICIVEGEKDADLLWRMGIPATTNAGGAGKWGDELNDFFKGGDVVVIPDRDPQKLHQKTKEPLFHPDGKPILPGQDHAQAVALALSGVAKKVRVLELWQHWKQMPLKGDVYDWIANGGTTEQLYALIDKTPDWKPQSQSPDTDPIDLWGSFEPPTLPRDLLPKRIERYALKQAATMGVDPGGVAMAALAVCAGAIPDNVGLVMKQHSREWVESARLWVGLVGLPSTKKSPIVRSTSKPLARLDAILLKDYLCELERWKQLDKEARKLEQKPLQKRLRLEDTTIEAAQEALAGSPNGLLLVQDELSGFFGAMDKYGGHHGAAKDRGFWLQSYNGGPYALNRINRGIGLIPNLSVSLLGGIQPDVIRRLASESYDDGFLQRMLLIVLPPAEIGADAADVSKDYAELIARLTKLRRPVSGSWNDDNDGVLRFENRAQDIQRRLEVEHHALERIESVSPKMAAHFGKLNGLFGRLCVAFHCIEHAFDNYIPEFVSEDTAERVAKFMRQFLLPHALAFYSGVLGLSNDHDRLAAVAGYILAHNIQRLTNREVQRGCRSMRKLERRDTEAVFEQLEALGWVVRTPGPRLTVPPHWDVNPRVHDKFEKRAKAEAERRQRDQAMILDIMKAARGVDIVARAREQKSKKEN